MALHKTYPQHSAREHDTAAMFLIAIAFAFAIVFVPTIPQAFADELGASEDVAVEQTADLVSETVPVQVVPLFETLSGFLTDTDTAWADSQSGLAYTNQTVPLVIAQQADVLRVIGIASFIAIGLGGLAMAFVMRRNDAPRAEVLQYN